MKHVGPPVTDARLDSSLEGYHHPPLAKQRQLPAGQRRSAPVGNSADVVRQIGISGLLGGRHASWFDTLRLLKARDVATADAVPADVRSGIVQDVQDAHSSSLRYCQSLTLPARARSPRWPAPRCRPTRREK